MEMPPHKNTRPPPSFGPALTSLLVLVSSSKLFSLLPLVFSAIHRIREGYRTTNTPCGYATPAYPLSRILIACPTFHFVPLLSPTLPTWITFPYLLSSWGRSLVYNIDLLAWRRKPSPSLIYLYSPRVPPNLIHFGRFISLYGARLPGIGTHTRPDQLLFFSSFFSPLLSRLVQEGSSVWI
jgi:hypothetical protein